MKADILFNSDVCEVRLLGRSGDDEIPTDGNEGPTGIAISRLPFRCVHWHTTPHYPGIDHLFETALQGQVGHFYHCLAPSPASGRSGAVNDGSRAFRWFPLEAAL